MTYRVKDDIITTIMGMREITVIKMMISNVWTLSPLILIKPLSNTFSRSFLLLEILPNHVQKTGCAIRLCL